MCSVVDTIGLHTTSTTVDSMSGSVHGLMHYQVRGSNSNSIIARSPSQALTRHSRAAVDLTQGSLIPTKAGHRPTVFQGRDFCGSRLRVMILSCPLEAPVFPGYSQSLPPSCRT